MAKRQSRHWNWVDLPAAEFGRATGRRLFESDRLTITRAAAHMGVTFPEHSLLFDQWVHVLDGRCTITCEGGDFELRKGSMLFIPAGVKHSGICRTECEFIEFKIEREAAGRRPTVDTKN